jgi:hypothetical protein
MVRDHPFGVGWNQAAEIYRNNYAPPEYGGVAVTTNDYLMLGMRLGLPGLFCFVVYVALQLGAGRWLSPVGKKAAREDTRRSADRQDACVGLDCGLWTLDPTKVACRAATLGVLVEFWFDGGLFKLSTAATFWILLELGRAENGEPCEPHEHD